MEILNDKNFDAALSNAKELVLVDFFASWCGPCRMLAPVLEQLTSEVSAKIYKVDVDESETTARKFGVMSIPTMIIFKNGNIVDKIVGYLPKDEIKKRLENL